MSPPAAAIADGPPVPSEVPETPPSAAATSTAGRRERRRRRRRSRTGAAPVDRFDRFFLTILGLVAIALGVVALLAADGERVDLREPGSVYVDARQSAVDHPEIWTAAAVAGGVVVFILGLLWAWAQVRPRPERGRLGATEVARGRRGRTTLAPAPLAQALAADVRSLDEVADASARVVALGTVPEVLVSVETLITADLAAVRAAIEAPLARMAASLGVEAVDAEIRIRIGRDEAARVV